MALDTFDEARMRALKDYAELEHQICLLLMAVLKVEAEIASAVFYQISNTRSRYAIISSLLDIRHKQTFAKAWPRLEHWLKPRDSARNHIVHWGRDESVMVFAPIDNEGEPSVHITPYLANNVRKWRSDSEAGLTYSEDSLRDEAFNVRVMMHIINRFALSIREPADWPWTDIFQQPIADQKPAEFLQTLNGRGHPALA
jgi:hypothetical protein